VTVSVSHEYRRRLIDNVSRPKYSEILPHH